MKTARRTFTFNVKASRPATWPPRTRRFEAPANVQRKRFTAVVSVEAADTSEAKAEALRKAREAYPYCDVVRVYLR